MTELHFCHHDSPIGPLLLAGTAAALHFLSLPSGHKAFAARPGWVPDATPFDAVRRQLDAYFAGTLRQFDVVLHLDGTAFQTLVWRRLAAIPYGQTTSYGALASGLALPGSARAVGAANGNNPIPIILPCHRVIGKTGALTGFGGGLPTKAFLLRLEGALPPTQLSLFEADRLPDPAISA